MFEKLKNPIPPSFVDDKTFIDTQKKYDIVPYFGDEETTSHKWVEIQATLGELSPALTAIKKDFNRFCFDAGMDVVRSSHPSFMSMNAEQEEVRFTDKLAFIEKISSLGISPAIITDKSKMMSDNLVENGNAYLKVSIIKINGEWKVSFENWHYVNTALLLKKRNDAAKGIINTPKFCEEYWKKNKPSISTVTRYLEPFNWEYITKGGVEIYETVIQMWDRKDASTYYGRSCLLGILDDLYTELNYRELTNKISNTEVITKVMLAFSQPDPASSKGGSKSRSSQFKKMMNVLKRFVTAEDGRDGNASAIAGIQYPHSGKPPTPIKLDVNRDWQYQEKAIAEAKANIYSVLGWSQVMTGHKDPSGGIGSNARINEFLTRETSTILPRQNEFANMWNWLISGIMEQIGDSTDYGIKFNSLVDILVERMKGLETSEVVEVPNDEE